MSTGLLNFEKTVKSMALPVVLALIKLDKLVKQTLYNVWLAGWY